MLLDIQACGVDTHAQTRHSGTEPGSTCTRGLSVAEAPAQASALCVIYGAGASSASVATRAPRGLTVSTVELERIAKAASDLVCLHNTCERMQPRMQTPRQSSSMSLQHILASQGSR